MMIDTHVHLTNLKPADRDRQIEAARKAGTQVFLEVAGIAKRPQEIVDVANSRDDVYSAVSIHPVSAELYEPSTDISLFKRLIKENKRVVCVGECGLDYAAATPSVAARQRQLFRDLIRLARESGLPLNIHSDRLSSKDILHILREEKAQEVGGVMHSYQGNAEVARESLDMGFYISASALIMHPLANRLRNVFRDVSIGQMVMETDSPAAVLRRVGDSQEPFPYDMDKSCEPRMLRYICDRLAEIKGMPTQDVETLTTLNARRLFRLP